MEAYWEWLCSIPGLYRTQIALLMQLYQTPEQVWRTPQRELEHIAQRGCGWIRRISEFQKKYSPEYIMHIHRQSGIQFTSCENPDYPRRLISLSDKPFGLFFKGQLPAEEKKSVAIVGARMCTRQGKEMAELLAAQTIRAGGQVVSGAAYGIDGAAQWAALSENGRSYAVLGCGVDQCYPASHKQLFERLAYQGGILSEFAPGTRPERYHFPMRNRIISGLSDAVVVVEARKKSGSLITAEFAAEQGRRVLAVPGRPGDELSEGCNELISQGSELILSVDSYVTDVFPDYCIKKSKLSEDITLAPSEKLVYSSLGLHSKNLWELQEATALSFTELSECLLKLESRGLIEESEQNWYRKMK